MAEEVKDHANSKMAAVVLARLLFTAQLDAGAHFVCTWAIHLPWSLETQLLSSVGGMKSSVIKKPRWDRRDETRLIWALEGI